MSSGAVGATRGSTPSGVPSPAPTPSRSTAPRSASAPSTSAPSDGPRPGRGRTARVRVVGAVVLVALAAAAVLLSLAVGSRVIAPGVVWQVLGERLGLLAAAPTTTASAQDATVVWDLRVPRTVLGLLAGSALGAAGALMQGHTRNPLADPGLLGVSAGAALAVVLSTYVLGVTSPMGWLVAALVGSAVAATAVFGIAAAGRGAPDPLTLVLAGTAVTALLVAVTSAVVLRDQVTLDAYRFWSVGALTGTADVARASAPLVVVGLLLAAVNAPALNALGMGEDVARSLGTRVGLARTTGVVAIVLLVGAATAACGPIAFVGLIVPHVVRALTGPDHRWLVPCSALTGVVLVLGADVLGRVVVRPGELQVGIVLAVVGAPAFVALVRRRRLAAL